MKQGTTAATAANMKAKSQRAAPATSGNKNVTTGANRKPTPASGRTGPIKGMDRGGV